MSAAPNTLQAQYFPAPIINQHATWSGFDGDRFCTVATTYMFLAADIVRAHLRKESRSLRPSDLDGVYNDHKQGSGSQIAKYIKKHTELRHVIFQTWSKPQLVDAQLTLGFPVPIGVSHWQGADYHELGPHAGRGNAGYDRIQRNQPHYRDAGRKYPDGHWGLVVGFDQHDYFINDPDTGTVLRWSRGAFERHNPYMVYVTG